ncbi:MAG: hypothetical protein ABI782_00760, partial [Anaerolineaceae bacterium]
MTALPSFILRDAAGADYAFPSGRPALLCFVKEDCPTCVLTMPLITAAAAAFGESMDVWAIGQDAKGNANLVDRFAMRGPILDDSDLHVSYRYDLDTVPTVILADAEGNELERIVGFS